MNPRVKFIRKATGEKNFLDEIRNTKRQVNRMETSEGLDSSVQEAVQSVNFDPTNFSFYANDSNGNTSFVIHGDASLIESIFGVNANFVVLNSSGVAQVWGGAGNLAAMAGNWIVDSSGQSMNGLLFPLYFTATNEGEQRQAWLGLSVQQGSTVPVFSILFTGPDGTNLLTNGDGTSETGWTDAEGDWEVTSDNAYSITYPSSFRHIGSGEFPAYLIQNVTVTAGDILSFGYASYLHEGILSGRARLKWKDGGGSVIQTDTLYGSGGTWQYSQQTYIAPTSTASVDIEFDAGDPFNDWRITFIQLFVQSVSNELRFSDEDLTAIVNGTEYDLLNTSNTLFSQSNLGSVAVSPSVTTVFDVPIPASWLTGNNRVRWKVMVQVAATTSRTLTYIQSFGGTNMIAPAAPATGTNKTIVLTLSGEIWSTGTDAQKGMLRREYYNVTDGTSSADIINTGTGTKDDAVAQNLKLTLMLSGAVTSSEIFFAEVEKVTGV